MREVLLFVTSAARISLVNSRELSKRGKAGKRPRERAPRGGEISAGSDSHDLRGGGRGVAIVTAA